MTCTFLDNAKASNMAEFMVFFANLLNPNLSANKLLCDEEVLLQIHD